jgi:hypothetical protein
MGGAMNGRMESRVNEKRNGNYRFLVREAEKLLAGGREINRKQSTETWTEEEKEKE